MVNGTFFTEYDGSTKMTMIYENYMTEMNYF